MLWLFHLFTEGNLKLWHNWRHGGQKMEVRSWLIKAMDLLITTAELLLIRVSLVPYITVEMGY